MSFWWFDIADRLIVNKKTNIEVNCAVYCVVTILIDSNLPIFLLTMWNSTGHWLVIKFTSAKRSIPCQKRSALWFVWLNDMWPPNNNSLLTLFLSRIWNSSLKVLDLIKFAFWGLATIWNTDSLCENGLTMFFARDDASKISVKRFSGFPDGIYGLEMILPHLP